MKEYQTSINRIIVLVMLIYFLLPSSIYSMDNNQSEVITNWQIKWREGPTSDQFKHTLPYSTEGWIKVDSMKSVPVQPLGISSAWIKMTLPQFQSDNLGFYIPELYAQNIAIYLDEQPIYHIERNYLFDENRILLAMDREDSGKTMYIWIENLNLLDHRIGINKGIEIGNYTELLSIYAKTDLISIILGGAFVLIALIMLVCSFFLTKKQKFLSISLSILILSLGLLFIIYPPYIFIFFEDYGATFNILFDIALLISIPSLLIFFELIFGSGYYSIITRLRKFQVMYSLFCIVFMIINYLTSYQYNTPYYFASVTLFGIFMIIQMFVLCIISLRRAFKRNIEAIIFSAGIALLTSTGIADLVWFYAFGSQNFFLWRWGVVSFVISLILLLGRNLASYHKQITTYTNKLEEISFKLQRSEKMEIISELAASIAHEVRNPLQVTRGFLQLFAEKTDHKEREYMKLAIQELDRAANIITDFLTFAKPELDDIAILDIEDELKQIEGIIMPLANLQGGRIELNLTPNLFVQGSSAKFKQAMINIIKNSIEAFGKEGQIQIKSFRYRDEVVIQIVDNGEGLDSEGLLRLGEPYFSTKTKGTGLGLMVTFRIIEVMLGSIVFNSTKGEGTEVLIRFPCATQQKKISHM
jgi:two-component system sporulation sensor kinase B